MSRVGTKPGAVWGAADSDSSPRPDSCLAVHEITHRVGDLSERLGAQLIGPPDLVIRGLNELAGANRGDMTFIGAARYASLWAGSKASAAVVTRNLEISGHDPEKRALLMVDNADLAMAALLAVFKPPLDEPAKGIADGAHVDSTAEIDASAAILAGAYVGPRSRIGCRTVVEPNVYIGSDCQIGDDCVIRAGAVVRERCTIGNRVSINANAVIGSDGFGYRPDGHDGLVKMPHIGTVEIHDDVEIGACTSIDRGKFGATVIGTHSKLDNLVQIGHNVRIGRACVLAAMTGVGGSVVIGDFAQLGGQVGIADHAKLGDRSRVAAQSGVFGDLQPGETVIGSPAETVRQFCRGRVSLRKLPALLRKLPREDCDWPERSGHRQSGP